MGTIPPASECCAVTNVTAEKCYKVLLSVLRQPHSTFLEPMAQAWQQGDSAFWGISFSEVLSLLTSCHIISPMFIKHQPGTWFLSGCFSLSVSVTHTHMHAHSSTGRPPAIRNMHPVSLKGSWQESLGKHTCSGIWAHRNLLPLDKPWPQGDANIRQCHKPSLFAWPFRTPCLWALEEISCRRLADFQRQLLWASC